MSVADFFHNYLAPTKAVYAMWVLVLAVALFSFLATRRLKDKPGLLQNIAEMAVGSLDRFFGGILGRAKTRKYFSLLATFFIFITICNYSSLIPGSGELFMVPTAHLAVTGALAIIAFFSIHALGMGVHGPGGYLKTFLKPIVFLLPLTLIEQLVRPFSLALRLYGNVYGEEQVTEQLTELFPLLLPLVMQIMALLFCLIQAMVFTMLLAIFIDEATELEEE